MKPFINLDELDDFETFEKGPFGEKCSGIDDKIGAKKLGYSITILQPGKKVCPFHNHRINEEMFLILEGTGTLRFGENEYPIKNIMILSPALLVIVMLLIRLQTPVIWNSNISASAQMNPMIYVNIRIPIKSCQWWESLVKGPLNISQKWNRKLIILRVKFK
jgi:hypothetical protein